MLLGLPPPPVRTPDIREREFRSFVCVCVRCVCLSLVSVCAPLPQAEETGKKRRRRSSLRSDGEEKGESGVKRLRGEALTVLLSSNITTTDGMYMFMRDAEGRKKQARSNEQQGKATQHTQGSHFSKEK